MIESILDAAEPVHDPLAAPSDATQAMSELEEVRRRLSGKDKALTALKAEQAAWQAEREALAARAATAEQQAQAWYSEALRAKYPRVAATLPEGANLDAAAMAALEDKFAELESRSTPANPALHDDDTEYALPVNANNPRRQAFAQPKPKDQWGEADLLAELRKYGEGSFGGKY